MKPVRPFGAFLQAVSAAVQGDAPGLKQALSAAPAAEMFRHAARHRCAGLLLGAIIDLRVRDAGVAGLRGLLQRSAAARTLEAQSLPSQISGLVKTLNGNGIPHALLKSAARIYAGEARADWSQICDIDILIPAAQSERAVGVLLREGYRATVNAAVEGAYRRHHHHLAPLSAPGGGRPLEMHVALGSPWAFTMDTSWSSLRPHMEAVEGAAGTSLRLDAFGTGLHMIVHGTGLYRISDAALLARDLQNDPGLLRRLAAAADCDRLQRVALLAGLAVAAQIAGLSFQSDAAVRGYVDWAIVREDLPALFRNRVHFVDAWFANGGRLSGPATALAFPRDVRSSARGLCYRELAGRVLAAIAATGYCARRRNDTRV